MAKLQLTQYPHGSIVVDHEDIQEITHNEIIGCNIYVGTGSYLHLTESYEQVIDKIMAEHNK